MPVFDYTGNWQYYTVPAGVHYIKAVCKGAAGGDWNNLGPGGRSGRGAIVTSYHKVTPGELLHICAPNKPGSADNKEGNTFGGGGSGGQFYHGFSGGNSGGGCAEIRRNGGGENSTDRMVAAGGGGGMGTGGGGDHNGGDGGPANEVFWANDYGHPLSYYSGGGHQTSGGEAWPNPGGQSTVGTVGGFIYGGRFGWSGTSTAPNGGGGAGGWYGGAGGLLPDERLGGAYASGAGAGGGGGSSRVQHGWLISNAIGDAGNTGNGQVTIDPYTPPNPTIAYPVTPHVAPRYAFQVNIGELHPNPAGVRTVTYELSQSSTWASGVISKTVNFVSNGADGKLASDPNIPSGANTLMNFWVSLLKTGTWYLRVRTGGNNDLATTSWVSSTFTVVAYKQPTPVISFPVSPATSRRFAFQVNVGTTHPTGSSLTVAYDLSPNADFSGATSKSVTFAANVDDAAVAEDPAIADVSSGTAMNFWVTLPAQGTFYLRTRVSGTDITTSDYASTSFSSSHQPATTIVSPTGSAYLQYSATTPFRVNVTDPWAADTITAYQLIVERNDTGAVLVDTGKMPLAQAGALGQNTFNQAISSTHKDLLLRWKMRVWDSTDVVSAYTDYALFTLVDPAVVTITAPTEGQALTSGVPDFAWTVGLTAGRTLVSSTVTVREAATNNTIWQRTVGAGVTSATPETTILVNQVTYSVTVDVTDSAGLANSDSNLFSTSYVSPDPILYTVDASQLNTQGYIEVNWANQAPDARLVEWRVYRRELPSSAWVLMERIPDEAVKVWRDYLVQSGTSYMYTISQLADRSGALLESPVGTRYTQDGIAAESQVNPAIIDNYWIIAPDRPELSVMLPGVVGAGQTEEWDQASYTIIGRGRHVDYGDRLGWSGTLEVQIRQPERESLLLARVEALRAAQETYYLRTPFGRLFPVALGNLGWEPLAGTGPMEMGDLSIPYEEVA